MTDHDPGPHPSRCRKFFRFVGRFLRLLVYLVATLWAFGAIYFDGPAGSSTGNLALAIGWAGVTLAYLLFLKGALRQALVWVGCLAVVLVPWLTIQPSNDRAWKAEWARTGWVDIEGDTVTFHNFRNFDYAADGTVTERWEERTVHLSKLRGLDYFQDNFYDDLISHPMLSFDFGEDGRVVLSIESRREKDERFGVLPGLYKTFELHYIFGDERDLVRVRTNVRNEPVRLFRSRFSQERTRETFLAAIQAQNRLRNQPRFYNVFTTNCTTGLRALTPARKQSRWDYRILANGRLDELLYERDAILHGGLSHEELRKRALITEKAQAAHDDPEFSARIREGVPGFEAVAAGPPSEEDAEEEPPKTP